MRIRRLTVKNFGKFENYAVDFNGNLAVINGRNEAGKSTIFDMIKVLLFGLGEDATPEERLSYVRYGANEAHISGEFERADGSPLTLSRIISKHSCDLNMNENFDFKNLGDVAAPIAADLSKEVYENIYALDFHAMSAIKDDIWQGIREEFMSADMAKELVSANEAIGHAKHRAASIYENESSPSAINDLYKERDSLIEKLDEINRDQKSAAKNYLSLDKTKREISDMQNKIEFESVFIREAEKMNGLKDSVERIKSLAQEAGDLSAYKPWLPNVREKYLELKQDEEDARDALESAKAANEAAAQPAPIPAPEPVHKEEPEIIPVQEMPEKYKKALEHEQEIRALRDIAQKEPAPVPEPQKPEETIDTGAKEEWDNAKNEILNDTAPQDEVFKSLDQINTMSLAEKLDAYSASKEKLDSLIQDGGQPKKSGLKTFFFIFTLIVSIAFVITGLALFFTDYIGGLISNFPQVYKVFYDYIDLAALVPLSKMITADLLCGLGLILLIISFAFIKNRSPKAQLRNREEEVEHAREEAEQNRAEFEKQLYGLPIPKVKIKRADESITSDIMRLKEVRQKLFEANKQSEAPPEPEQEDMASDYDEEVSKLAYILLDFPSGDSARDHEAIDELLDEAMQFEPERAGDVYKANEAEDIAPVVPEPQKPKFSEEEIAKLQAQYHAAAQKASELETILGEDPVNAADEIGERYNKLNKAVVLRDEILEKYPDFKEVSERLSQLTRSGWPYTNEAVTAAQGRIDDMRASIGDAQSRIGVMENSVKKALLGHDPAEIASRILQLDDKILQLKLEYDKMSLSEVIIQQGHDTFSKLHQPEVLQRASYYLSILTDGKYEELDLDGETSEITVMLPDGRYLTPQAARLSQATREQIYLSIRLSVIESFDEGREAMPITLDEALITWDKGRLTSGLDLLARIAHKRQILIFTCHDFIVDTMKENQPTAQIIDLK